MALANAVELTKPQQRKLRDYTALAIQGLLTAAAISGRSLAHALRCPVSTVWSWWKRGQKLAAGKEPTLPGPLPRMPDVLERNDILTVIHAAKGRISTRALRAAYPGVTRAAIRSPQKRYQKVTRKRGRRNGARLQWNIDGAVWAMDHTDFAGGVEDGGRSVLVVRARDRHHALFGPL